MRDIFGQVYAAPPDAVEEPAAPGWLSVGMAYTANPHKNQSEGSPTADGLLIRSPWGQRFRNAILFSGSGKDLAGTGFPQTAFHPKIGKDSAGKVVREMSPLYNPPSGGGGSAAGYRDLIGAFATRAAYAIIVVNAIRYKGQLPLDQQPEIKKPLPWSDPTRGSP